MNSEEKISAMFILIEKQQKAVQDLITNAKEIQNQMERQGLNAAQLAVKAVEGNASKEVKESFNQYESNLKTLLEKAKQANASLENATNKLGYKLILSLAVVSVCCVAALFGVYLFFDKRISHQLKTIATLEAQGGNLQFSRCDGQVCIKVQDQPTYGEDGEYRIVIMK